MVWKIGSSSSRRSSMWFRDTGLSPVPVIVRRRWRCPRTPRAGRVPATDARTAGQAGLGLVRPAERVKVMGWCRAARRAAAVRRAVAAGYTPRAAPLVLAGAVGGPAAGGGAGGQAAPAVDELAAPAGAGDEARGHAVSRSGRVWPAS